MAHLPSTIQRVWSIVVLGVFEDVKAAYSNFMGGVIIILMVGAVFGILFSVLNHFVLQGSWKPLLFCILALFIFEIAWLCLFPEQPVPDISTFFTPPQLSTGGG
jgi:hypothetical protein